ncbi:MAG: 3 beta-hydroxysteroid dehydrogenase/Delta 5--_4-isomerase [Candidatus Heimdallarchaeota archaeon LC_2]|nr:MAG: 3 beta-hydroxysteroid dehydrogenase/Delta 5-->4-isomerase [Candidatus Heimdallarchaeota archaeon LC_2]
MRILVIGATGYLGFHVSEYLNSKNHEVVGFVRNPKKAKILDQVDIKYVVGDVNDPDSIVKHLDNFDAVVNCAGYVAGKGSWKTFRSINADGPKNIAEAMKEKGIKRLIHISSIAAYGDVGMGGDETTPIQKTSWFKYGVSKREGEENLEIIPELDLTMLRPPHIVGRRDRSGFIPMLYHTTKRYPILIDEGAAILPLVYVDDVCHAIELCLENNETIGEIYNTVSSEQPTVRDVVEQFHVEMSIPLPTISISFKSAFRKARLNEYLSMLFKVKLVSTRMNIVLAGRSTHFNSDKIIKLGWKSSKTTNEMISEWCDWRKEFEKNR